MMCHTIYFYLFWCKLNSLVLADLFIQEVIIPTGRSLHHVPRISKVVICHWVSELSLQVFNACDAHRTGYKHLRILKKFTLSMEPSFDAWLKAEMRVFNITSRQRLTGWMLEQSGVRTTCNSQVHQ